MNTNSSTLEFEEFDVTEANLAEYGLTDEQLAAAQLVGGCLKLINTRFIKVKLCWTYDAQKDEFCIDLKLPIVRNPTKCFKVGDGWHTTVSVLGIIRVDLEVIAKMEDDRACLTANGKACYRLAVGRWRCRRFAGRIICI